MQSKAALRSREYQLKTQGSKKQLLSRLATAVREERLGNQLQQRRQDYREHVVPFQQQPTSRPSEEEVEMHNLTHLPFQPWCEHCVAWKRGSPQAVSHQSNKQ